jgi:hypothetical protein
VWAELKWLTSVKTINFQVSWKSEHTVSSWVTNRFSGRLRSVTLLPEMTLRNLIKVSLTLKNVVTLTNWYKLQQNFPNNFYCGLPKYQISSKSVSIFRCKTHGQTLQNYFLHRRHKRTSSLLWINYSMQVLVLKVLINFQGLNNYAASWYSHCGLLGHHTM